jgi:hypothetical protein
VHVAPLRCGMRFPPRTGALVDRVLERRGLPVTDDDRARISYCDEVATLERWLDLAVTAARASELFDR